MSISPGIGDARGTLAVITPSYGPDFELCKDLNRSVLEMTAADVVHHIIVPKHDLNDFHSLAGPRTEVHDAREYLPHSFLQIPRTNVWINAVRPWPPVRGWICQQIIKLAIVANLEVGGALLIDSDSVLVRPTSLDTFSVNGSIGMYRKPSGVDDTLPGHRLWHSAARELLGLEPPTSGDLTDYICWPCLWEPAVVRDMLPYIERTTGTAWTSAVASQLRFSEMMLYGIYVDEILGGKDATFGRMHGVVHSDEVPLGRVEIEHLFDSGSEEAVLVMLSAKSGIPLATRRRAIQDFVERLHGANRAEEP